jgi:hypothetical protein
MTVRWEDIVTFCVGGAAVIGFVTIVGRFTIRPFYREVKDFFHWWKKFMRDWDGTPEEPGRAKVPGVMERLNRMDGELQRNGGSSLKDKVFETLEKVEGLDHRVDTIEIRQCEIQKTLNSK